MHRPLDLTECLRIATGPEKMLHEWFLFDLPQMFEVVCRDFNVTQVLSVEKNDSEIGTLSSLRDIVSHLVTTTAAESYFLGTVTDFIGSSLDLPITKEHLV